MIRGAFTLALILSAAACFSAPMPATEAELREELKACQEANRAIVEAAIEYRAEAERLRDLCR